MGQFSWLDCVTGKPILDGVAKTSYVLVPREFGGGHIEEDCYDGYGNFGGYDIYDLVAYWNKDYLLGREFGSVPKLEDYAGLWSYEIEDLKDKGYSDAEIAELDNQARQKYYQAAVGRKDASTQRMLDFSRGKYTDAQMRRKYGNDFKREIGIDIACYDEDNFSLKYPIKITYDPNVTYEECKPSKSDPNQGWGEAEPGDWFYGITGYIPSGASKLNKREVKSIINKVFSGGIEGSPDLSIRNAVEDREWSDDPDLPDDWFAVTLYLTLSDKDDGEYYMRRLFEAFGDAGYSSVDIYWEEND